MTGAAGRGRARQGAAQERSYLVQLAEDLRETERIMTAADSAELAANRAVGRLERAFYLSGRPPRDSLLTWIYGSSWIRPVRPVLGTAEALVSTGDLRLIRDDSLRSAVTAVVEMSDAKGARDSPKRGEGAVRGPSQARTSGTRELSLPTGGFSAR